MREWPAGAMRFLKTLFKGALREAEQEALPKTFEEAVDYVCPRIEADTVSDPYFHFTGGMAMRNRLNLWDRSSELNRHMVLRFGLCHGDDLSMLISHAADARKNGRDYCPDEDVWKCKQHWLRMGIDPATQEPLPGEGRHFITGKIEITSNDDGTLSHRWIG